MAVTLQQTTYNEMICQRVETKELELVNEDFSAKVKKV